jgi:hypothetical protein
MSKVETFKSRRKGYRLNLSKAASVVDAWWANRGTQSPELSELAAKRNALCTYKSNIDALDVEIHSQLSDAEIEQDFPKVAESLEITDKAFALIQLMTDALIAPPQQPSVEEYYSELFIPYSIKTMLTYQ